MSKNRKRIILYFSLLNITSLIAAILFSLIFKPKELIQNGGKSTCIFQKLFNFYCPGCGGTRSFGYLLSFDFINSFLFYPPILIGLFLIIFVDILFIFSFKKDSLEPIKKHKYFEFLLIPVSIILTFLIRNLLLFLGIDFIGDFIKNQGA